MAVVKADGYGHGAVEVARAALRAGASYLAVALVGEALELRRAGIEAPVLLLGYTDPAAAPLLLEHNLTAALFDLDTARLFSSRCRADGRPLPVHLKIDTGMGRVGVSAADAAGFFAAVSRLPGLKLEGIFTHLSSADEDDDSARAYTARQLHLFDGVIDAAREQGIEFSFCHAANSAAAVLFPQSRYNLVRIGISLYGCYPAPWMRNHGAVKLRPAMSLKSKIVFIKEVPPQTPLGYGRALHGRKISCTTVPGYAGAITTAFQQGRSAGGSRRAPVVGRICMDQLMISEPYRRCGQGDEVVLTEARNLVALPLKRWRLLGTINYELLCHVGKRVPRCYLKEGRPAEEEP